MYTNSVRPRVHTCAAAAAAAGGPFHGSGPVFSGAGSSSSGAGGSRNASGDVGGGGGGGAAAGSGLGTGLPQGHGSAAGGRSAAQRHEDELHTLNVAIAVNILIFAAKLWAHFMTGSSAMLAEAMHSVADVLNQMLLRIGLLRSQKGPTEMHPYGYTRDRFVWSLISAVGIFFLGAGASFIHGVHTLMEHRELEQMGWTYAVLAISGLLEGYSLWVAVRSAVAGAASRRMGLLSYIRSGRDPTTVAVMMEDGGAVMGLVIAGACTALAAATGNAMWDAAGSILVGCLLGCIATFLVSKNRQLLIGRSMAPAEVKAVQNLLLTDPVVASVIDTKTEELGPSVYRFKAEVAWNGDKLVERYMDRCGRERLIGQLEAASARGDRATVEALLRSYGRDLISAVGAEVDRIELDIQKMNPGILYVDLETDRGRSDPWRRGAAVLGVAGGLAEPEGAAAGGAGGAAGPASSALDLSYTCSIPDLVDLPAAASRGSTVSSSTSSSGAAGDSRAAGGGDEASSGGAAGGAGAVGGGDDEAGGATGGRSTPLELDLGSDRREGSGSGSGVSRDGD